MELKINYQGDVVEAQLIGELDTPATLEIQTQVDELIAAADKQITIDCAKLSYIASAGLRQLLSIRKKSRELGGSLTLVNMSAEVYKVFEITNFNTIFDIK